MKYRTLLLVPAIALLAGCSGVAATTTAEAADASPAAVATKAASEAKPSQRTVTYEVIGSGKSTSITYLTLNGGKAGQSQANGKELPWKKTLKIKDDGLFETSIFSLVAQAGEGTEKITCKITADGKVIDKQTSTGAYAVATCSGSVG